MMLPGNQVVVQGRFLRIARLDGEKYTFPDRPEEVAWNLNRQEQRIDLFTFLQHPPETTPRYPYHMEWDNLAVLPITTFDAWWSSQITKITRNRARLAEKRGVIVREVPFDDHLLRGIVEIHNETPVRQGRSFPHYGMDMEGARRYAGTFLDRSFFIGALMGGELIGFMKLSMDQRRVHACVVNILGMLRHRDKGVTNALIAEGVRCCAERGLSFMVYEHFTYGRKNIDSLGRFKESNGFCQMDLPRYYVPLTTLGRAGLRLGLHRRLIDYCPEPIMSKARDIRSWWYATRHHASSQASAETAGR